MTAAGGFSRDPIGHRDPTGSRVYSDVCRELKIRPLESLMRSKRLQAPISSITSFDYSHRALSPDDCRGICSFLRRLPNLTHLAFNQIPFNNLVFSQIIEQIERTPTLENLELFGLHPPASHVPTLHRILLAPRLQRLKLGDNSLTPDDMVAIAEAVVSSKANIVQLHLGGNDLGSSPEAAARFLHVMAGYEPLMSIGLRSCKLDARAVPALIDLLCHEDCRITDLQLKNNALCALGPGIVEAFKVNKTLRVLELESTQLDATAAQELGEAIPHLESLRALNLNGNQFGDAGLIHIAGALSTSTTLSTLGLSNVGATAQGAARLAAALGNNSVLAGLDISQNDAGDLGAAEIAALIRSPACPVESVDLSSNGINPAGGAALAAAVAESTRIKHVDLGKNALGDVGAQAWGAALRFNRSLQRLCLTDNRLSDAGGRALLAGLHLNTTLTNFSYGGQSAQRNDIDRGCRKAIDRITARNQARGQARHEIATPDSPLHRHRHVRTASAHGIIGAAHGVVGPSHYGQDGPFFTPSLAQPSTQPSMGEGGLVGLPLVTSIGPGRARCMSDLARPRTSQTFTPITSPGSTFVTLAASRSPPPMLPKSPFSPTAPTQSVSPAIARPASSGSAALHALYIDSPLPGIDLPHHSRAPSLDSLSSIGCEAFIGVDL